MLKAEIEIVGVVDGHPQRPAPPLSHPTPSANLPRIGRIKLADFFLALDHHKSFGQSGPDWPKFLPTWALYGSLGEMFL